MVNPSTPVPPAVSAAPSRKPGALFQITLYFACVLVLGAVLAPLLYHAGKGLAGILISFKQSGTPILGWIARKLTIHEFDTYYNRAFLIASLGLLWPFLKWMGLSRQSLGLQRNPRKFQDLIAGLLIAAVPLALMGLGLLQAGAYLPRPQTDWNAVLTQALLAAVGASLLEEWVFRGWFLGVALRTARVWQAVVFISAFFSILHLMQAPDPSLRDRSKATRSTMENLRKHQWTQLATNHATDPSRNDWMTDPSYGEFAPSRIDASSGFRMTARIFQSTARPALFLSEFLTLFMIGLLLAIGRIGTASLWFPIGLHAGWILLNTLFMGTTMTSQLLKRGAWSWGTGADAIPWIGTQLKIGLLPLAVLGVTSLAVAGYLRWRSKRIMLPAAPPLA